MALGISITGILTIVVVVLALVVILLGIATRVKKLKTELKAREDDNVTPYLRAVSHYSKGNFDVDTKMNALNKISKQFLRDIFKFNSEKTFEEIGELSHEEDIKIFCNNIGVFRYSKSLNESDVDNMYSLFQKILTKRLPKWVTEELTAKDIQNNTISIDELMNKKMKRDITDIKNELDKMSTVYPKQQAVTVKPNTIVVQNQSPQPKNIIQNSNSLMSSVKNISIEDRLSLITEEIDKNNKPVIENNNVQNVVKTIPQNNVIQRRIVSVTSNINPNKVISSLVNGSRVEKIRGYNQPLKVFSPKKQSKSSIRLPLKTLKINTDDDNHLNREIESLSERLNRLVGDETQKRLSSNEF